MASTRLASSRATSCSTGCRSSPALSTSDPVRVSIIPCITTTVSMCPNESSDNNNKGFLLTPKSLWSISRAGRVVSTVLQGNQDTVVFAAWPGSPRTSGNMASLLNSEFLFNPNDTGLCECYQNPAICCKASPWTSKWTVIIAHGMILPVGSELNRVFTRSL